MSAKLSDACPVTDTHLHPSVEMLVAYIEYYGFDFFITNTLSRIDMTNKMYTTAVDEAVFDQNRRYDDSGTFSLARTFQTIVTEMMEDDDLSEREALEFLAEDDYVIPVNTAMYYSIHAGDTDIERLSTLIRNRASRLLERMDAEAS